MVNLLRPLYHSAYLSSYNLLVVAYILDIKQKGLKCLISIKRPSGRPFLRVEKLHIDVPMIMPMTETFVIAPL